MEDREKTREEMMDNKKLNIYGKLSAISVELNTVAKNLDVGVGQNKYKAVGEADVLRAVKPLEAKYGVYSYPVRRTIIESGTVESVNYKGEVKKNLFERIEVIYRFVNIENPSEIVDITSYGDGIDSQDKSVGKAMTYADKYALLKAYKIVTGDDPDQNASEDLNAYMKETSKPREGVLQTNNGEDVSMLFNQLYAEGKSHSEILKAICENKKIDFKRAGESVKKYVDTGKADDLNYKQLKSVINELCQG